MEIPVINPFFQPAVNAGQLSLEQLAGNPHVSEKEKIGEVCRQFEAVLLREILQSAQKTVFQSSYTDDSAISGIYKDMVTNQLADSISRSGSFGLARSLEAELTRQLSAKPNPEEPLIEH